MDDALIENLMNALAAGLIIGCLYGLMCIGLGLIFGVMKIVNFAQGELLMLGLHLIDLSLGGGLAGQGLPGQILPALGQRRRCLTLEVVNGMLELLFLQLDPLARCGDVQSLDAGHTDFLPHGRWRVPRLRRLQRPARLLLRQLHARVELRDLHAVPLPFPGALAAQGGVRILAG